MPGASQCVTDTNRAKSITDIALTLRRQHPATNSLEVPGTHFKLFEATLTLRFNYAVVSSE